MSRLVRMRTSLPSSVVSKIRSIVSLPLVWLTYCLRCLPSPSSLSVLLTVYCSEAGLNCTGMAVVSPIVGVKVACVRFSGVAIANSVGMSNKLCQGYNCLKALSALCVSASLGHGRRSGLKRQSLMGQVQLLDANLVAAGVQVGGLELHRHRLLQAPLEHRPARGIHQRDHSCEPVGVLTAAHQREPAPEMSA